MDRRIRTLLSLAAGVAVSGLFCHWAVSTLRFWYTVRAHGDWYHYSFLWLFERFWALVGIGLNQHLDVIGVVTAYCIYFLVPFVGVLVFLVCSGLWSVKRTGLGALVALLCSVSHPAFWIAGHLLFIAFRNGLWSEFPIMIGFLALCVYVAAPRRSFSAA